MKVIKISDEQYSRLSKALGTTMSEKLETFLSVKKSEPVKKSKEPTNTAVIGKLFKEEYLKHYGYEYPSWGARENGQITTWLKSITMEQAKWLVTHYMAWNNPSAVKSGHPLGHLITRYVELVSDYKNPKAKFKRLDAHQEQKEEIKRSAISERFGESYADSRLSAKSVSPIQDKTQGRVLEISGDPFTEEGSFGITNTEGP